MEEEEEAKRQSQVISECIAPLQATIREIEELSRRIPAAEDFHFYSNFEAFKGPVKNLQARTQALLSELGECKKIRSEASAWPSDPEESYDWLVSVQDDVLEGVGAALDQMGVGAGKGPPEFLLEKKKTNIEPEKRSVRVASNRKQRATIPFHVKSLARPQDKFDYPVDNSNQPFQHLSREELLRGDHRHAEGLDVKNMSFDHPLKEDLDSMTYMEKFPAAGGGEPLEPKPLSETPFTYVESLSALETLAKKLQESQEFAVDLENHHYRSFQGFVCLMQLSTRLEDFVVDTLTLREHIGPVLRSAFANPSIRKVIHGSDKDIIWLQRDFQIYVCNSFDTGQAARVLNMEKCGLAYLLQMFCGVQPDKRYQLADWRLRPLTSEMLRYAREDTHYLLYVYDKLKEMLLDGQSTDDLYVEVCKRSRDLCLQLYEKDLYNETSFKHLHGLADKNFGPEQLSIVDGLHAWRDKLSRREDESTGYVLPNSLLFRLAEEAPEEPKKLQAILKGGHPVASFHAAEILEIIRRSKSSHKAPGISTEGAEQHQQQRQPGSSVSSVKTAIVASRKTSSIFAEQSIASAADEEDESGEERELSMKIKQVNTTVQLKKSAVAEALFRPASSPSYAESDDEDEEDTIARVERVKASVILPFLAAKAPVAPEFEEPGFEAPPATEEQPGEEEATKSPEEAPQELGEFIEIEQEEALNKSNFQEGEVSNKSNSPGEKMNSEMNSGSKIDELPPSLNQMYGKKHVKRQQRKQEIHHHPERKKMKNNISEKKASGAPGLSAFAVEKRKSEGSRAFDPSRSGAVSEGFKAGKKRQVFPRSGNRSATFK